MLFFGGAAGGGKGLDIATLLPTPSGFVRMGDVSVGDMVFDQVGQPCRVTAVSEIHHRRCFDVEFDDGTILRADDEHRWITLTAAELQAHTRLDPAWRAARRAKRASRALPSPKKPWVQATVSRLNSERTYDYKDVPSGSVRSTLEILDTLCLPSGRRNHAVPMQGALRLPAAELPLDPYTLGVFLGDGGSGSAVIGMADADITEMFAYIPMGIKSQRLIGEPKYKSPFRIVLFDGLRRELRLLGILAAGKKRIPPVYKRASEEQRRELLRGILDTDGHVDSRGQIELALSNRGLAEDCLELLSSLGVKGCLNSRKTSGADSHRVKFVAPFPAFKLTRKLCRQKVANFRTVTERRYVVAITEVPSVPTRCIAVDSPSHMYLAGPSMVPTHNTFLLLGLAAMYHRRSIIFRREYKQLEDIREKAERLYHNIGTFNGQRELWRLVYAGEKRRVRFGAMQLPGDELSYQGQQMDLHCVGVGTPVLMADGSKVAIEAVRLGDFVQTIEGPRRVVRLLPKRRQLGVRVFVYTPDGRLLGSQVQSRDHELLTTSGWVSHSKFALSHPCGSSASISVHEHQEPSGPLRELRQSYEPLHVSYACPRLPSSGFQQSPSDYPFGSASCAYDGHPCAPGPLIPTLYCNDGTCELPTLLQCSATQQHLDGRRSDQQRAPSAYQAGPRHQGLPGTCVLLEQSIPESGYAACGNERPEGSRRPSDDCQCAQGQSLPVLQSTQPDLFSFHSDDGSDDHYVSSPQCSAGRCSVCSHLYDEQLQQWLSCDSALSVGRVCPPLLVYVEPPNPTGSGDDGRGKTPKCSRGTHTYSHPYRTEIRSTSADLQQALWEVHPCGEVDLYDIEVDEVNHYISGPGLISKNCFDEVTHFQESQFRFVTGWNRSDVLGQRSRVIAAGNPPTNAEGYWVIKYWAPWLDPKHPNPAKDGELRWFAQLKDPKTDRFMDMEVAGPNEITIEGEPFPVKPRSRTFIRAFLTDNPVYMASGYMAVLQGMPEPLRSQMLHGDFLVGHEDHPNQVIPTEWVMAAQARWKPLSEQDARMRLDSIGVDVARGGKDNFVLTRRYGTWFDEQISFPGQETPDGFAALQKIVEAIPPGERPAINIDVIGVGGSVYDIAKASGLNAFAMDARNTSFARDGSGTMGFAKRKSEWWWRLREALDPALGDDLALPPDRQLLADLTAPRYQYKTAGIQVEDKDDLIARIGRSPDFADSLVLAHAQSVMPISTHLL